MQTLLIDSVDELKKALDSLPRGCLFRGQVNHYSTKVGPSVQTSFDREGCIPRQMLRWSRYADNVLNVFHPDLDAGIGFNQAILQHYGWQSFYIDCTSDPAVATWFASHRRSESRYGELCEDYEERPVLLQKRRAEYAFEDGEGHLYVFDQPVLAESVGAIDLSALKIGSAKSRTLVQKAWLAGPLRKKVVPPECFAAHITAPRAVFKQFSEQNGFVGTQSLFPSVDDDPILAALLGLPWKSVTTAGVNPIPIFRRSLDLPEYEGSFVKISPSRVAFFEGKRIADTVKTIDGAKDGAEVFVVPEIVMFGTADDRTPMRFPEVEKLLDKYQCVAFEMDELIQHANMGRMVLYQKGIGVWAHEKDFVEVMELMVEHPGLDLTKAGFLRGWYYRIGKDGTWTREHHGAECDCGKEWPHKRHMSALNIAEAYLRNPRDFDGMR